jgi:ABC-type branched-subunit amino acid transport system substrate-binding protein
VYRTAFEAAAEEAGIEIVDSQTIEAADSAPPSAQLNSIAGNQPDVIMAVPLGPAPTDRSNTKDPNP